MITIDDWINGKIIPRRDHSPKREIALRNVRFSARMGTLPDKGGGTTVDEFGREFPDMKEFGAPDNTVGDDECWGLWPFDNAAVDNREIPAWANAWPAELEASPSANDQAGAPSTTTVAKGVALASGELGAFPVRNVDWDADKRFAKKKVSLHPAINLLPRSWPGIVIPGTEERRQDDLFFPAGAGPLVAPWHDGSPELGSWVYDATALDELDFDRRAHLQSAFRVWKIPPTCGPNLYGAPGTRGIAYQMAIARGSFAGRAVFADFPDTDRTVSSRAQALAGASHHVTGLFHVGAGSADQHTEATNADGDTVGPLHGNPRVPWHVNAGQCAPFLFTEERYRAHEGSGDLVEVRLVIDNTVFHPTHCGPKVGYHRWQVRVPYYFPPPPPPPKRPPPPYVFSVPGFFPDVDVYTIPGISPDDGGEVTIPGVSPDVDGGGGGKKKKPQIGGGPDEPGKGPIIDQPNGEGGIGTTPGDIANLINALGLTGTGAGKSIGKSIADVFGTTVSAPFGLGLLADIEPPRVNRQVPGARDGSARSRFGLNLPVVQFPNEVGGPGMTFFPQQFSRAVRDFRYSQIWDGTDAKKLSETTPAIGRFEAIGNQYGAGWTRTYGMKSTAAGQGVGRYLGGTAQGALWFLPPEIGGEQIYDGKVPASISSSRFGISKWSRLAFGTPIFNGLAGSGFEVYQPTSSRLAIDMTDGSGDPTQNALTVNGDTMSLSDFGKLVVDEPPSTPSGFVPIADGSGGFAWGPQTTPTGIPPAQLPKNYVTGFTLSWQPDPDEPSLVEVSPGLCRSQDNTQDIFVGDPNVDYLSNGLLANDGLLTSDTGLTGNATTGTWLGDGAFGVSALSGDIRPRLRERTLTGTIAVSARSGVTLLQKLTGTGSMFLSELALGDIAGNATCGHGMVAQVDSNTVAWIVKEFSDLSSATYAGQTFKAYENVCVQVGIIPSVRISEIAKDGKTIYSPDPFNGGGASGPGLNIIVGQPAAARAWTTPPGIRTPTWVYLWARAKSDGTSTLSWSTQRTLPYTPATLAGYTAVRRVGVLPVFTDNFVYPFSQANLGTPRKYELEGNDGTLAALNGGPVAVWTRVPLSQWVPPTARRVIVNVRLITGANSGLLSIRPAGTGDPATTRAKWVRLNANDDESDVFETTTDGAQCLDYSLSGVGATAFIYVVGYIDTAGEVFTARAVAQAATNPVAVAPSVDTLTASMDAGPAVGVAATADTISIPNLSDSVGVAASADSIAPSMDTAPAVGLAPSVDSFAPSVTNGIGVAISNSVTLTFVATGNLTVPAGVTSMTAEAWGGGGGGGGAGIFGAGGGGGGGGYAKGVVTVAPGDVLNLQVGVGGGAAGDSEVTRLAVDRITGFGGADGANGGLGPGAGGAGGTGSGPDVTTNFTGGAGAGGTGGSPGGGGGGGAGATANGTGATAGVGGAGGAPDGGTGGNGAVGSTAATPGATLGGGGGGADSAGGASAAGARGAVRLTFSL